MFSTAGKQSTECMPTYGSKKKQSILDPRVYQNCQNIDKSYVFYRKKCKRNVESFLGE